MTLHEERARVTRAADHQTVLMLSVQPCFHGLDRKTSEGCVY